MPEKERERASKFNLITGQDSYASQVAQNPETSRRILGLIPSQAGYIERQSALALYATGVLPAKVLWLWEFDQNVNAQIVRYYFAATSTQLFQLMSGVWTLVTQIGNLAGPPVAVRANNLMHFSDGAASWLFDGTNWVTDGLAIPLSPPAIQVSTPSAPISIISIQRLNGVVSVVVSSIPAGILAGSTFLTTAGVSDPTLNFELQLVSNTFTLPFTLFFNQPGFMDTALILGSGTIGVSSFSIVTNAFFWTTFADETPTHPHESSSSPISVASGAITNQDIIVKQRKGTFSVSSGSPNVVGSGTDFNQGDVGQALWGIIETLPVFTIGQIGTIASVQDSQHLTLASNALANNFARDVVIAPLRATNWNIYTSESENSQTGFFLASVPLSQPTYLDQSPFAGNPDSYIDTALERPIRNDPPEGSIVMELHKNRIFRRDPMFLDFVNFTAYEEVLSTAVGDAYESVPGNDPNTISDLVDNFAMQDQSSEIRALCSFADSLFIGTEKNVVPLFGQSIDDFVLSDIVAFNVGAGSRYCMFGSANGMIFFSYDKKVYLWPSQWIPFFAPNETSQLIELSRPLRTAFQTVLSSDIDNTHGVWYNYGKRNWYVFCFQDNSNVYHTWVFDVEIKGWFELNTSVGISSLFVFTPSLGNRVLVGGGVDGNVYVLDDQTGSFPVVGNLPAGTFRTALIDFGNPDSDHILKYLTYEVSNPDMEITVNYWLDPVDVDNPGTPSGTLVMASTRINPTRFRGMWIGPALCQRALIELDVASDQNNGVIRSVSLAAEPASGLASGSGDTSQGG